MYKHPYWHYPQALTTHELNYLREVAHQHLQATMPGIHLGEDAQKRSSEIAWCTDERTLQIATSLIYEANRNAGWWLDISYPEQVQVTQYFQGGHYDTHRDSQVDHHAKRRFVQDPEFPLPLDETDQPQMVGLVRKLSLTLNLSHNHEYQGGELQLEIDDQSHVITGLAGSATVFPSWTQHCVCPVTSGERRSMVLWVSGPPIR